jgi:hypothetical protein
MQGVLCLSRAAGGWSRESILAMFMDEFLGWLDAIPEPPQSPR